MNKNFILPNPVILPRQTLSPPKSQPLPYSRPPFTHPNTGTPKAYPNYAPPYINTPTRIYNPNVNMKSSHTSVNSSINNLHVRDSRSQHENIYYRNNNINTLERSPDQRNIVGQGQQRQPFFGPKLIYQPRITNTSPRNFYPQNLTKETRPASPSVTFKFQEQKNTSNVFIQHYNAQADSNKKIIQPDSSKKKEQLIHNSSEKLENCSYTEQNTQTKETSEQENNRKSKKSITNHIYMNEGQCEKGDEQEHLDILSKQIKDSVRLRETYEEWKQKKDVNLTKQGYERQEETGKQQQCRIKEEKVRIKKPEQISNSIKESAFCNHQFEPKFFEEIKPLSLIQQKNNTQPQDLQTKQDNQIAKEESFEIKQMQIQKVRSEVIDQEFLANLDDELEIYQPPTFKVLENHISNNLNQNKVKTVSHSPNFCNSQQSDLMISQIGSTHKMQKMDDQLIIKQQQIEIKRLRNQLRMMKLREKGILNQMQKLKKQNYSQKQLIKMYERI